MYDKLNHDKIILKYIDVKFMKIGRLIKTCIKNIILVRYKFVVICDV